MFLTETVIIFNDKQQLEHRFSTSEFSQQAVYPNKQIFSGSICCIISYFNMHDIQRVLNATWHSSSLGVLREGLHTIFVETLNSDFKEIILLLSKLSVLQK